MLLQVFDRPLVLQLVLLGDVSQPVQGALGGRRVGLVLQLVLL